MCDWIIQGIMHVYKMLDFEGLWISVAYTSPLRQSA